MMPRSMSTRRLLLTLVKPGPKLVESRESIYQYQRRQRQDQLWKMEPPINKTLHCSGIG